MNTDKQRKFIINAVFYAIIFSLIFVGIKYLVPILLPFILAFVFASILQFPVKKLSGLMENGARWKRVITIIVGVIFFGGIFLLIAYAGIKTFNLFLNFLEIAPAIYQNEILPFLNNFIDTIRQRITFGDPEVAAKIDLIFDNFLRTVGNNITTFSMNAIGILSSGIAGIPGLVIKLIICIVSCFFFMLDYDKVVQFCFTLIPAAYREKVDVVKGYIGSTLLVYLRSYFFLFCLTCFELSLGLKLLGIPYAVIWGCLIGVFDILPVLGTGGILMPWGVILLVTGNIPMGIGILVVYFVITVIRNILEPRLVGKQIGLHPLATLISLYVGLKMLGFIGMFVFPVSLAILSSMKRDMGDLKEERGKP
ncbi:MAG: sporulation integral membrane protein YtvI [Lachnospiraceae bacterium]|nr:sporulation integral membrane protein YtvI [Lachnospiraceae bacterium]